MNSHEFSEKRHQDLWIEQSRQVGRWIFGISVFAVLACVKVLGPFADLSERQVQAARNQRLAETRLAAAQADLEASQAALKTQTGTLAVVNGAAAVLKEEPWAGRKTELQEAFRRLRTDYEILESTSPGERREWLEETGPDSGSAAPPVGQLPPALRREGSRGEFGPPLASRSNLAAQVPPALLEPGPGSLAETRSPVLARRARQWEATEALGIGREQLRQAVAAGSVDPLLREQTIGRFAGEASNTVQLISSDIRQQVLAPLAQRTRDLGGSESLDQAVTDMDRILVDWQTHAATSADWWQTVQGKESVIGAIGDSLEQSRVRLEETLKAESERLEAGVKAEARRVRELSAQETDAEAARQQHAGERAALEQALDDLLPSWLRGLVSIENLFQGFPLALLGLAVFVAFKLLSVRRHFSWVQRANKLSGAALADPATSTLWTLTWRGPGGSLATAAGLMAFVLLSWALFEVGWRELAAGLQWVDPADRWFGSGLLRPIRWAAALVFVVMLVGIPTLLLRSRHRARLAG
ncbi:MAG: hypothetical protein H7A46_23165 [Verrucomicrobiales bacterium]|nr:hypothetical protein [Verrucomicrobiales bacterium]